MNQRVLAVMLYTRPWAALVHKVFARLRLVLRVGLRNPVTSVDRKPRFKRVIQIVTEQWKSFHEGADLTLRLVEHDDPGAPLLTTGLAKRRRSWGELAFSTETNQGRPRRAVAIVTRVWIRS